MNKQLNNDDKQEDSKQNINLRRASALSSGSSVSSVGSLRKSSHFGLHKIWLFLSIWIQGTFKNII